MNDHHTLPSIRDQRAAQSMIDTAVQSMRQGIEAAERADYHIDSITSTPGDVQYWLEMSAWWTQHAHRMSYKAFEIIGSKLEPSEW